MKQVSIKILAKGDSLFEFSGNRIIIRKKNGEYWIYQLHLDGNGLPMLNDDQIIKITFGKGTVELHDSKTRVTIRR